MEGQRYSRKRHGYFSWWGFTYNDTTSWEIDFTPKSIGTPIPNSVWLLGSGLSA